MDPIESRVAEVSNVSYRYLEPEVRRPNHYPRLTIVQVYHNMRFGSLFKFSYWNIYHGGTRFKVDPLVFCVFASESTGSIQQSVHNLTSPHYLYCIK